MKNMFIKPVLLALSVSLIAGCSSNTQQQNTGIGVATGAVVGGLAGSLVGAGTGQVAAIAVGAVAGGIIGGVIGHSMDSSDCKQTYIVLEHNRTHKYSHWKNKRTGHVYTLVPTSGPITVNGNPNCRQYRSTAIIHGKTHHYYGTACRQADGTWITVNP